MKKLIVLLFNLQIIYIKGITVKNTVWVCWGKVVIKGQLTVKNIWGFFFNFSGNTVMYLTL